ncbi:DUF418 domain-containing protein [bacterium]|nr:DUF418 domain-containing protein [bacterium]
MENLLAPVREPERIDFLDVLRGFAVCGILAMNIQSFAMPGAAYFNPLAYGDFTGANYLVWLLANALANQKFMTLFSMLFGAGVLLMCDRARAAGRGAAGLHYRRMGWLLLFGLAHAYLVWAGDILVDYALCGLLVFVFRKARPGWLLASGLLFLLIGSLMMLMAGLTAGTYWPPEQLAAFEARMQPSAAKLAEELAAYRGTWLTSFRARAAESAEMQLTVFPFFTFWRVMGVMLLGMTLYRWRVLTGEAAGRVYGWLIGLALLVGLPATIYGAQRQLATGWDPIPSFFLHAQWGYWASLLVALGWLGALVLLVRASLWSGLRRRLAACGRMAFSCYILTSLICTALFYGHGLGLFGRVSRLGQAGITLAVWLFLLWLAPFWLARFRFGPLEWLWRSLAYRARQPWRRRAVTG